MGGEDDGLRPLMVLLSKHKIRPWYERGEVGSLHSLYCLEGVVFSEAQDWDARESAWR